MQPDATAEGAVARPPSRAASPAPSHNSVRGAVGALRPQVSRRNLLIGSALGLGAAAGGTLLTRRLLPPAHDTLADRPLHSLTAAFSSADERSLISSAEAVLPGSRVQASAPAAHELLTREREWLASLAGWTRRGPHAGLVRDAYLDLFVLTEGLPATVAGWTTAWRHIWPRDTAHAAVAFAAAGDLPRAETLLDFLADAPRTDEGWFEARYALDGTGAPDDRSPQFDGLGWAAWAVGWIHENAMPTTAQRDAFVQRRAPFARSLAQSLLGELDAHGGRPPVSSDYWEVFEWRVTLGTAAPALAGLQRLQPVLAAADDPLEEACARAEAELSDHIAERFAAHGFPRHAGGSHADSAVGFMLPPYVRDWRDAEHVRSELARTEDALRQPAGGISPGERWARDGVSWTPETAVFALAHATSPEAGHRAEAVRLLDWLGAHRTPAGSYPEKVLAGGEPAAVAPLAWTAACVALAAHSLSLAE
ncbi:hypothetical protein [Brevibacterium album]|uniref:hypothetical protein n=1 Tax=Brevibacterium album TaxID=417948 RepID=UPI0004001618|nr:hypothetical protein [Brevibacterium album]